MKRKIKKIKKTYTFRQEEKEKSIGKKKRQKNKERLTVDTSKAIRKLDKVNEKRKLRTKKNKTYQR